MASKRPICLTCSNYLTPWGKTSSGKRRFRCKDCKITRLYHPNKKDFKYPFFELFRQYILWGLTYQMLASMSGYSVRFLEYKFHEYLNQDPPKSELPLIDQSYSDQAYLLIDGLWFGRWFVLMVYRQSKNLTILHVSQMGREVSTKISKDLKTVKNQYVFSGVVSDGGTGIKSAIEQVFGNIPHYLQEYRRDEEGKWWYIHKGVRKAVRILQTAPDYSFTFLPHHLMPKTTNEIEATFGHLGKRWLSHRGLKRERWTSFLNWFVHFYNQEKLAVSNSKKD